MEQPNALADIGVVGMGVMGTNLAVNIERQGTHVAVWNITFDETDAFIHQEAGKRFVPSKTIEGFVSSIERPRTIVLMVTAGQAVDDVVKMLVPILDDGDIIVDGGNSWFEDTKRRENALASHGIQFIGMGVSGGADGARNGPCLMPGGAGDAYARISPLLEKIAAQTDLGPCVTHVGADGAGHFVKMVHNGIEYADMQLIAESYDLLSRLGRKDAGALGDIFSRWNEGILSSFLIELTGKIFGVMDTETDRPLVEMILDNAGQKGTGQWTAKVALSLGVSVPTIAAAVDARILSSMKSTRMRASRVYENVNRATQNVNGSSADDFEQTIHQALLSSKVIAYAQGLFLICRAAAEFDWQINLEAISRIWRGGCIIRAALLDDIMAAYHLRPSLHHLLLADRFRTIMQENIDGLRRTVATGATNGIPIPAFSASLNYFDSFTADRLPQNLIQAQRDAFGAHTYERIDKPDSGFFHTEWD